MARKSGATRVFQLAKQLGVTSKDVIAKCEAEGIPGITNHMSTVSLGLEATIREWFGDGSTESVTTAVQTAAPVDVSRARAKAKKKTTKSTAKSAKSAAEEAEESAPAEPVTPAAKAPAADDKNKGEAKQPAPVEPTSTPQPTAKTPTTPKLAKTTDDAAAAEPEAARPAVESETDEREADESTRAAASAPTEFTADDEKVGPQQNVPNRPDVIKPAGPMLQQPTKTKLSGPKVIRVETPDIVPAPRSKSPTRPGAPIGRSGPRAGRGAGTMGPPPTEGPGDSGRGGRSASRRNKRRSTSPGETGGRVGRAFTNDSDRPFNWREQDLLERENRLNRAGGFFKAARRDNLKRSTGGVQRAQSVAETGGKVRIEEPITIKELSAVTGVKAAAMLRQLLMKGSPCTINSAIDSDTAVELMLEHNIELEVVEQKSAEEQIEQQFEARELTDERPRSPIVTILGHVDHGKTSLLDQIRNTKVASGEAGGITQATSAFQVPVKTSEESRMVTFIDTPGHEAFTTMRARGAKITDIAVLVVAADDGVMPQTIESINHAKAAGVPIVVALNKIDKPEATDNNIQRILGQLAEHGLNPVDWGGETEVVRTSAIKSEGIQDLIEVLDYQAQLRDLKADFGGNAQGTVLEAEIQEGRGPVAKVLVQHGKLKKGDFVVVGRSFGRVRDIVNDRGQRIDEAGPSQPVAFSGINLVPDAGDKFYVVKSLRDAEAAAQERLDVERQKQLATERVTLDNIFKHMAAQERTELPLVLKADVHGSLETLKSSLVKLSTEDITIAVKHAAVGGINESDISLAEASGAIVLGFNVTASAGARKAAERHGVDIRFYDVIYDLMDDVKKAAEGLLEPELKLEVLGHAEVRDVFRVSKVGMVAGCYVTDGVIERNSMVRVTRDGIVIEKDRKLEQLKRFKDDVKEVRAGQECGMNIAGYDDIKVGDVLECYKTLEVRRTL